MGLIFETKFVEIFFKIAIILAGVVVVILGFKILLVCQQNRFRKKQKNVLLAIRVSRLNEKLPIVAEQMFAVLHGIEQKLSFFEKLKGATAESFSFEIANVDGQIKFFVYTPRHLRNFVEGQIYAQYPDIEIEEIKDYIAAKKEEIRSPESFPNISAMTSLSKAEASLAPADVRFDPLDHFAHAFGAELTLEDIDIYPIKRHSQFEDKITRTAVDPLSGITSALMKLPGAGDLAAVQIVVRPLGDWWRIRATKCARILGKNIFFGIAKIQKFYARAFMTREFWPRIVFFPFYLIFFFQGLFAGSRVKFSSEGSDDVYPQDG